MEEITPNANDVATATQPTANNEVVDVEAVDVTQTTEDVVTIDTIAPPIMIMFGEFLGYVSPLLDYVDLMCSGKEVHESIRKAMSVDAHVIYNKMREEFTDDELSQWFAMYYEAYLEDRENELKEHKMLNFK